MAEFAYFRFLAAHHWWFHAQGVRDSSTNYLDGRSGLIFAGYLPSGSRWADDRKHA
jgi:hypothetical protein